MRWNTPAILALLAAWEGHTHAFLGTNSRILLLCSPQQGRRVGSTDAVVLSPSSTKGRGIELNASRKRNGDNNDKNDKYNRKYLLQEYSAWKQRHNKSQQAFDPMKFEQFTQNFQALQQANTLAAKDAIAKGLDPPIPRQLNHYADWSPEDYRRAQQKQRRMMKTKVELPTTPTRTVSSRKSQQVAQGSMYFVGGDASDTMAIDMDWFTKDITMDRIDKIRTVYRKFVQFFDKDFSEARLEIFGAHLRQIERRGTSSFVDLNEYADWTTQEYREFGGPEPNRPTVAALPRLQGSGATPSTAKSTKARRVYEEWCEYYDKTPTRFEAFLENWELVQHHHANTGKSVDLNEWADLTPAEYQLYVKHGQLPRGYEIANTMEEEEEEDDDDVLEDAFLLPSSSTPSLVADSHFIQNDQVDDKDNFFDAYDDAYEYEKEEDDLPQPPPRRRPSAIRVDQDTVIQNIRPLAPPSYSRRSTSSRTQAKPPMARKRTVSTPKKQQRKTVYVDPTSSMDLISTPNLSASSRQTPKSKVSNSMEQEELERLEALEEAQHRAEEQILLLEEKQRELEEAEQRLLQEEARLEAERLAQEEERRKQKEKEEKQRAESTRRLERFAKAAREKAAQVEMGSTVSSSKLDKFQAFTEAKRLAEEAQKRQAESNERRQGSIPVAAATPDGASSQERLEMELQRRAEEEAAKAEEERLRLEEDKRQEKEAEELRLQLEADEKRAKEREAKTMEDMQRRFEAERTKKQRIEEDRSRQLLEQQRQFAEAEAARLEAQHRARERDQQEIERQRILQEETRKEELARQRRAEEKLASIKEREAEQARIRAQEARLSEIAEQRKAEDKMKKIEEARRRADEIAQLEEAEMRRKQEEETRINQENAAARAEAVDRQPEQEVVINTNSMSSFFKSGFQGAQDDAENDSISSFPSTPVDDEPIISKPVSKTVLSTFDNSPSSQPPFEAGTTTSNSFGSVSSEENRNEPGPPSFNNPASFDPNQSTTEATKPATSTNQVPSNPFASFDPTANQATAQAAKLATSTSPFSNFNQVQSNPFASFDPTANQSTKPAEQPTAPGTLKPFGTPKKKENLAGAEPSDQSLEADSKAKMEGLNSPPFSPFKAPGGAKESPFSSFEPMGKGDKDDTKSQPPGEAAPDSVPFGLKAANDKANKQGETTNAERREDMQEDLETRTNPFASFPVPPGASTQSATESKDHFTAVKAPTEYTKKDDTQKQDGFPIVDASQGDDSRPKPFPPFPGTSSAANTPASKPFAPKPFAPFNPKASDENKTEGSAVNPSVPFPKAVENNTAAIDENLKSDISDVNEDQEGNESKPKPFAPFPGTSSAANTPASKPFAPKPFAPFNPKASDENKTEGSAVNPSVPFLKAVEKNTTAIDQSSQADITDVNEDQEGDESKPKPFAPFPGTSSAANTPASKPFAPKPFAPFNPKASDENKTEGSPVNPFVPFPKVVEKNTTAIDQSSQADITDVNEDQEGDESKPKPFAPFPGTSSAANTPASKPFAPKPFAPFNPKASDENKTEGSPVNPFVPFPKAVENNTTAIDENLKSDITDVNEDQEGDESKPKPFAPFPGTSSAANTPASKPFAPKPFAPFNPKASANKKTEGSVVNPSAPFPKAVENNTAAIDENLKSDISDANASKPPMPFASFPTPGNNNITANHESIKTVIQEAPAVTIPDATEEKFEDGDEMTFKPLAPFPATSTSLNTPTSELFAIKPFATVNPQASGENKTEESIVKQFSPFPTAAKKNSTAINDNIKSEVNAEDDDELRPKPFAPFPGTSTGVNTPASKPFLPKPKPFAPFNPQASGTKQTDGSTEKPFLTAAKKNVTLIDGGVESEPMETTASTSSTLANMLKDESIPGVTTNTSSSLGSQSPKRKGGKRVEQQVKIQEEENERMKSIAASQASERKQLDRDEITRDKVIEASTKKRQAEIKLLDDMEVKQAENLRMLDELDDARLKEKRVESEALKAASAAKVQQASEKERRALQRFQDLQKMTLEAPTSSSKKKPNPDTKSQSNLAARLAENNELEQRERENRKKFETLRRLSLEEVESRPQISAQETPPISPKRSSAPSDDFERREAEKLRFLLDLDDKLKQDEKRERKVADSKLDEKRSEENRRVEKKIANAQRSFGKLQEMELKSALGKEAEARRQEEQRKARLQKKETKRRGEEESRLRDIARRQAEEREQILLDDAKNSRRKASLAENKPDLSAVSSLDDSIVDEIEKQRVERLRELSLMDETRRQQAKSDTLRAELERKKAEDKRAKEEAERLKMMARRQAEEREEINKEEQKKDSQAVELNQSKSKEQPGPSIKIVNAYEQEELVRQQKKEMQRLKAEAERERQKQRARKAAGMKGIDIIGWVRPKKKVEDATSEAKPSLQDESEWTGEPVPGTNGSTEQAENGDSKTDKATGQNEKSNLVQDDVELHIKEAKPESTNKLKQLREQEELKRQRREEIERLREEVEVERQAAMEVSENDTIDDSFKTFETEPKDKSEAELRATELSKLTQQAEEDAKKAMETRIKLEESARAKEENLRREQAAQAAIAEKQAREDAAKAAEMIRIQEEKFKRERAAEIARLKQEAERERMRKAQVDAEEVARVEAKEAAERCMQQERFERERAEEIARLKEEAKKERQLKAQAATSSASNPTVFEGNPVEGKSVQARDVATASQATKSAKDVSNKEAIQRRLQQEQFERERRAEIARLKEEAEKERQLKAKGTTIIPENRPAESMIEKEKRITVHSSTDDKSNISQPTKAASAARKTPNSQFDQERAKEIARLKEVVEREQKERDNAKPRTTSRVPGRPSFSLSKAAGTVPEKTRVKPPLTPTQSTPSPEVSAGNDKPGKGTSFPTTSKLNMTEVAQSRKKSSESTKTEAMDDSLLGKVSSFFGFGDSKSAKKTKTDRKAMEESKASWDEIRRKRQEATVESNRLKAEQEEWKKVQLDLQRESEEERKSQKQQKQKPQEEKKNGSFDLFNIFGGPTLDRAEATDPMFFLEKEDKDNSEMEETDPLFFATKGGDEPADDLFFLDTTNGKSKPFFLNPDGSTTNTDASVKKTKAAKSKTTQPKPIGAMKKTSRPSKEASKPAKEVPDSATTPERKQPKKAWYNSPNSNGKSTSSAGISRVNGTAKVNGTTNGGVNGNAQSTAPTKLPINGSGTAPPPPSRGGSGFNGDIPVNGKASQQNPSSPFASSKRVATFDTTLKKKDDPNNKPAPSSPFNQPNKEESPFSFLSQANQAAQKSKPPPATRRSNQTSNNPFSFLQKANEAKQQQDLPPPPPPKTTSFSGKEVVTLSRWWQASDRSLTGFVNEEDEDGTSRSRKWTTAPLAPGIQPKKGQVVETQDGNMYRLE